METWEWVEVIDRADQTLVDGDRWPGDSIVLERTRQGLAILADTPGMHYMSAGTLNKSS